MKNATNKINHYENRQIPHGSNFLGLDYSNRNINAMNRKIIIMLIWLIAIFNITCFAENSNYPEKAELKFHLNFKDEDAGETVIYDKAGGLKAILHNTSLTEGRFGNALSFNGQKGKKGSYVVIPESTSVPFLRNFDNGPFTIEIWFKPDKDSTINQEIISNTNNTRGRGYRLSCGVKYGLCPFISGSGEPSNEVWSIGPKAYCIIADTWNYVAIVRDIKGFVTYYHNGMVVAKSKEPFKVTESSNPLIVGAMRPGCPYYPFKGTIDDLRIYKGARTAKEISIASLGLEGRIALNLDGKFNEAIWKKAKHFTNFNRLTHDSKLNVDNRALAKVQTEVMVTHDMHYLYFGIIASEPQVDKLKDTVQKDSLAVYDDDSLEIMLDLDDSSSSYYQMLLNSSGYHTQMMVLQGGAISRPLELTWFVHTAKEENSWAAEIAIPFAVLNQESSLLSRLRFNVGRSRRIDLPIVEQSSLIPSGAFHEPMSFIEYGIMPAEAQQYSLRADKSILEGTAMKQGMLHAGIGVKIKTLAEQPLDGRLHAALISPIGNILVQDVPLSLASRGEQRVSLPFKLEHPGMYTLLLTGIQGNRIIFHSTEDVPIKFTPLSIDITRPFYRNNIYFTENVKEIEATIEIGLFTDDIPGKMLKIMLKDLNGEIINEKEYNNLEPNQKVTLAIPTLIPGKYHFTATLLKNSSVIADTSEIICKLSKAPGTEVRVDEHLRLIFDGKPILPIFWWGEDFEVMAKTGADGVITGAWSLGGKGLKSNLDKLHALGQLGANKIDDSSFSKKFILGKETMCDEARQYLTEIINSVIDHPALLCHYLIDEPENIRASAKLLQEMYEFVRELDPYHPVVISPAGILGCYTYVDCLDVFAPDPYIQPVEGGGLLEPMTIIAQEMDQARIAGKGKKLLGLTPQVFDFSTKGQRAPNFTEARCNQYLGIIHGARMLNYYRQGGPFKQAPDLIVGIPPLIKEIKSLAPMILNGEELHDINVSDSAVHLMALEYNGKLFIIACNVGQKAISVTVTVPSDITNLYVVSEKRQVKVKSGSFTDKFIPYGTNIYTSDSNFSSPISLAELEKEIKVAGGSFSFNYDE